MPAHQDRLAASLHIYTFKFLVTMVGFREICTVRHGLGIEFHLGGRFSLGGKEFAGDFVVSFRQGLYLGILKVPYVNSGRGIYVYFHLCESLFCVANLLCNYFISYANLNILSIKSNFQNPTANLGAKCVKK